MGKSCTWNRSCLGSSLAWCCLVFSTMHIFGHTVVWGDSVTHKLSISSPVDPCRPRLPNYHVQNDDAELFLQKSTQTQCDEATLSSPRPPTAINIAILCIAVPSISVPLLLTKTASPIHTDIPHPTTRTPLPLHPIPRLIPRPIRPPKHPPPPSHPAPPPTSSNRQLVTLLSLLSLPVLLLAHHRRQIPPRRRQRPPQRRQLRRQRQQTRIRRLDPHLLPHKHIHRPSPAQRHVPRRERRVARHRPALLVVGGGGWGGIVVAAEPKRLFRLVVLQPSSGADGEGEFRAEVDGGVGGFEAAQPEDEAAFLDA